MYVKNIHSCAELYHPDGTALQFIGILLPTVICPISDWCRPDIVSVCRAGLIKNKSITILLVF